MKIAPVLCLLSLPLFLSACPNELAVLPSYTPPQNIKMHDTGALRDFVSNTVLTPYSDVSVSSSEHTPELNEYTTENMLPKAHPDSDQSAKATAPAEIALLQFPRSELYQELQHYERLSEWGGLKRDEMLLALSADPQFEEMIYLGPLKLLDHDDLDSLLPPEMVFVYFQLNNTTGFVFDGMIEFLPELSGQELAVGEVLHTDAIPSDSLKPASEIESE